MRPRQEQAGHDHVNRLREAAALNFYSFGTERE